MIIGLKFVASEGFSKIWPTDLVFDPTWSILELVRYFIKINIPTKLYKNRTENVASKAYTMFL